jgi:hypothetical protein
MPLAIASNERPLVAVAHTNAVVPLRPVQVVRTAPSKVSSGSIAVLSPWSLNPVSILNLMRWTAPERHRCARLVAVEVTS